MGQLCLPGFVIFHADIDSPCIGIGPTGEIENRTGGGAGRRYSIAYEDMGNPDDPAALLIMGLGALLTFWQTEFCEPLVAHGYRVVRLDNRDKAENFTRAGQAQPE